MARAQSGGTLRNPSDGVADIRLLYNYRVLNSRLELFADIFNLFDNQNAIRNQDLLAGTGGPGGCSLARG